MFRLFTLNGQYFWLDDPPVIQDQNLVYIQYFWLPLVWLGRYTLLRDLHTLIIFDSPDSVLLSYLFLTRYTQLSKHVCAHSADVLTGLVFDQNKVDQNLDLEYVAKAVRVFSKTRAGPIQLMPVCYCGHWVLMVLDYERKRIHSIDSKDTDDADHYAFAQNIASIVKVHLMGTDRNKGKRKATGRRVSRPVVPSLGAWDYRKLPVPKEYRQTDDCDCGAYVCHYARQILTHGRSALINGLWLEGTKEGGGTELRIFVFDILFRFGKIAAAK